jgi:hypothetical protein
MYQARHASMIDNSKCHLVFGLITFNYLYMQGLSEQNKFVKQNGISKRNLIAWRENSEQERTHTHI